MGAKIYQDSGQMLIAAREIARLLGERYIRLPLDLCVESRAFGGDIQWREGAPVPGAPLFTDISHLELTAARPGDAAATALVLRCAAMAGAEGERIVFDISGPFSVLAALTDTAVLWRGLILSPEPISRALGQIADFLADYGRAAFAAGVGVISFADPAGVFAALGQDLYTRFCGEPTLRFLRALGLPRPGALLHLCANTTGALASCRLIRLTRRPLPSPRPYAEILFDRAVTGEIGFLGGHCLNLAAGEADSFWAVELNKNIKK
jgi:uroporphyrinogen-III decarboxylase